VEQQYTLLLEEQKQKTEEEGEMELDEQTQVTDVLLTHYYTSPTFYCT
jgi:hypothetical protein